MFTTATKWQLNCSCCCGYYYYYYYYYSNKCTWK